MIRRANAGCFGFGDAWVATAASYCAIAGALLVVRVRAPFWWALVGCWVIGVRQRPHFPTLARRIVVGLHEYMYMQTHWHVYSVKQPELP